MKKRYAYVIFVMILLSSLPFYSMIVKAQDGGIEDFEDDTPGSNPTEPWYTFTEEEGGGYGSVSNDNNATWTHTFEVDTSGASTYEYTGYMEFNNSTYARVSFDWRVDRAAGNWLSRLTVHNDSTLIAGFRNQDGTTLEAYTNGGMETVTGFTFQEDFWYDMQMDFNWTTDEYHIYINDTNYGWYDYYASGDQLNRFYIIESSVARKGHFWIDDIDINDTATGNVVTNGTTGVEEINATMWGYLDSGVVGNHYVWFQYGTTVNYGSNTSSYIRSPGDEFSRKQGGLSRGTLYHYRAVAEPVVGGDQLFGFDRTFSTKPNPPNNFVATTIDNVSIGLSWTAGNGAVNTVVSRNASGVEAPPAAPDDGTIIYNNTGTSCTDTGLNPCVNYSYAAWSWTIDKYSDSNQTGYNYTLPGYPLNVSGDVLDSTVNISWINGTNTDYTLIRKKSGSYPTDVTDGTELYNGTGNWTIETVLYGEFVSLWGYNDTYNLYSLQINMSEGGLRINCYDENTTDPLTFDIFMTNLAGTETYNASGCTNTFTVDITDAPTGDDILVYINSSGYVGRQYYADIYIGFWYTINAYLTNASRLYSLYVVNQWDDPVEDATMQIRRYINESVGFTNITVVLTDGYGHVAVPLIPEEYYKVIISKTGYQREIADFHPQITADGDPVAKTFKLIFETVEIENYTFWDIIEFNGTAYQNNTLYIQFNDLRENTTNAQFYTYELYNNTEVLNSTNTTTSNSFSFWVRNVNISRSHAVYIHLNHTELGYEIERIIINPYRSTQWNASEIEIIISDTIGEFNFGYVATFLVFIPALIILVLPGQSHPGIGIIGSGLWMGFTGIGFGIPTEHWVIAPFLMAIGILLIVVKGGEFKL